MDDFRFSEIFSVKKLSQTVDERLLTTMPGLLILNKILKNYAILDFGQNVYIILNDKEDIYNLHQMLR